MSEEVLFESEQLTHRAEVASYLRTDWLAAGDAVTLQAGGDSVTPEPQARPTFEVTAER